MFIREPYSILFFLIILLVGFVVIKLTIKQVKPIYSFSSLHFAAKILKNKWQPSSRKKLQQLIRILKYIGLIGAVFCLMVLFARPASETKQVQEDQALDIMTIIDGSFSMTGGTGSNNKFDYAKKVLLNFIAKATGDRIGVIYFATSATVAAPLTSDYAMLKGIIDEITADNIYYYFYFDPKSNAGTVIGDALLLATNRFPKEHKYKVAIIISDGENNGGYDPVKAATYAKEKGIIVYTIFVGSYDYTKDLKEISRITGGKSYQANDASTLTNIFNEIEKFEKNKVQNYSNSIVKDQPDLLFIFCTLFVLQFISLKYLEELWI